MAVVVDASAVGAIAFGEPEGRKLARYLADEALVAPELLDYELMNLTVMKVRRAMVEPAEAALLLAHALRLPVRRVRVPGAEVFALAIQTGLSAYDAAYLWLARTSDIELVTLDRRLADVTDALGGAGASYRISSS